MKLSPKIAKSLRKTGFKLKKASPTILTVIATGGVVITAVLSAKAAPKALQLIEEGKKKEDMTDISKAEIVAINIKYGWKPFVPVIIAAAGTITCILGSNVLNKKQQAALTSAYMMLESQYRDYRKKVIERHGEEEDKEIYAEIVKSKYEPIGDYDEPMTFSCEYFDKYFESTMLNVTDALNELNFKMSLNGYVTLRDLFIEFGLEPEPDSENIGWSDTWFLEGFGICPYIQYRFRDEVKEDGLKVREIYLWCDPCFEALDVLENPERY